MAKLMMETNVLSAESRAEPKLTVDYLVAAIQPTAVRACVKERMKLNENRGPKKDARDIKRWLADYIHRYGEFEALMATRHRHVQNVASCDQDPQGWKDPKVVAVVIVDKCLHIVFKCPKLADCEAKLLMERARSICQVGSVVPPTTLAKLKKLGRNVLVTELKIPIKVKGFVGPSHSVTEEATIDLRFETDAGPLMLTNVKCGRGRDGGCGCEFAAKLAALLDKHVDVFHLSLGRDSPVKMPPLKVL
ncbi:hypothetical protein H257_14685 [Aphanomyces astaci]|uniref:Uncharacterized protein n=1 Tax=Aphanomyces astaci TaxID=112090 RepID=W4FRT7_APHAT|nr:hypothetical protein H257_14685 [Aphanomyces astaci]ETV69661.1 hypothetical protein H257_14685 [Aphanomyces astaci]|eukprot:XP_009840877.1 hypothetical protein H257_14685 [Aphanomyces astaci]